MSNEANYMAKMIQQIEGFRQKLFRFERKSMDYLNYGDVERNVSDRKVDVDRWQLLGDSDLRNQIYSAYFDERQEIIGG
jgi:hypothetical protein